jgi:Domain of unknown function (DUF3127)
MSFQIKGTVKEVSPTTQVTESLKKREVIVEYVENNPSYPSLLKFEAVQDKCSLLDNTKPGDEIEVHFNLDGRAYTDKSGKTSYFNSLKIWRIVTLSGGKPAEATPEYAAPVGNQVDDEDALPF